MNQGDTLKKILKEYNVTQVQLAERLDILPPNLSKELGRATIDIRIIEAVCDLTDLDVNTLKDRLNNSVNTTQRIKQLEASLAEKEDYINVLKESLELYRKLEKERELNK